MPEYGAMFADRPPQNRAFWIGCLVVVSFSAGMWAAFDSSSVGHLVKSSGGVLLIIAGLMLLSPLATSPAINEGQRKARRAISVMGAGNIVFGAAQLVPSFKVQIALTVLACFIFTINAWLIRSSKTKGFDFS